MNKTQIILIIGTLGGFALLAFMFNLSLKKYDAAKAHAKKKKGRTKYMPQAKKF